MPQPVFLLVIMIVTGVGMWFFLGQMNGGGLSLSRLSQVLRGLKRPDGRRRRRKARRMQDLDDGGIYDEAGGFAPERSPFAAPGSLAYAAPQFEPVYEYEEDDEEGLPVSQVDFFAEDEASVLRPVYAQYEPLDADNLPMDAGIAQTYEGPTVSEEAAPPGDAQAPAIHTVAAEPDPNDIMSFFEKAESASTLPETLRENLETVSAAELLAQARELRAILQGRKAG